MIPYIHNLLAVNFNLVPLQMISPTPRLTGGDAGAE
jgi:hypothetical protein